MPDSLSGPEPDEADEADLDDLDEFEPTFALVNAVAATEADRLASLLEQRGFALLTLHGDEVRDKASFLRQVAADLPPIEGMEAHNWDAFADWYWNVLFEAEDDQVALLWTAAQVMAHGELTDFLDAVRILTDAARSIMDAGPRDRAVLLFLIGDGPEFRPLTPSR
jgi:Barstar (barnase inhibitor)